MILAPIFGSILLVYGSPSVSTSPIGTGAVQVSGSDFSPGGTVDLRFTRFDTGASRTIALQASSTYCEGWYCFVGGTFSTQIFPRYMGESGETVNYPECLKPTWMAFEGYDRSTGQWAVAWTETEAASRCAGSFAYSASNTNSARQNTAEQSFHIMVLYGRPLVIGTCGVAGSSFNGDTYLRLYDPSNNEVAFNDDVGGACGLGSQIVFWPQSTGRYTIRAGCYSGTSCSGTVAWTIQ